jgi:hypothetical protein
MGSSRIAQGESGDCLLKSVPRDRFILHGSSIVCTVHNPRVCRRLCLRVDSRNDNPVQTDCLPRHQVKHRSVIRSSKVLRDEHVS